MVLLLACTALGIMMLTVGVFLHLSLPGWQYLAGLGAYPASRREHIRIPKLRRRLSILFYVVAAAFLAGALLLATKGITPDLVFAVLPPVILLAVDGIWILYRIYDDNSYTTRMRRAAFASFCIINIGFIALYLLNVLY
ncbi:MAG TPA: hypothetical protein PLS27_09305 [Treponemataceae bacterium]|nr:hypothetical protein [Treponemataceae bacterium]